MSSFKAELTVDNKTFPLTRYYFETRREMDERGMPMATPKWTFWVNMDVTDSMEIASWMIDPVKTLDVTLKFSQTDQDAKFRVIKVEKAFCFSMHETYSSDGERGLTRIEVGGKGIYFDGTGISNY